MIGVLIFTLSLWFGIPDVVNDFKNYRTFKSYTLFTIKIVNPI